jgi:hypothetical protein
VTASQFGDWRSPLCRVDRVLLAHVGSSCVVYLPLLIGPLVLPASTEWHWLESLPAN